MKQLPHKINSDREGIRDTNDCTVRAFMNAYDLKYAEAHALSEKAGRKKGKGHFVEQTLAISGKAYKHFILPCPVTAERFLELFPKDKIAIVRIYRHVFCVKDGIIHDHKTNKASKLVYEYWLIGSSGSNFECPVKNLFKGLKDLKSYPTRTQELIVRSLGKLGLKPSEISDLVGIQISNVSHYYSKLKIGKK